MGQKSPGINFISPFVPNMVFFTSDMDHLHDGRGQLCKDNCVERRCHFNEEKGSIRYHFGEPHWSQLFLIGFMVLVFELSRDVQL